MFFLPILIADMKADDPLVAEEQFVSALHTIKFSDAKDVIVQANASKNGLGVEFGEEGLAEYTDIQAIHC